MVDLSKTGYGKQNRYLYLARPTSREAVENNRLVMKAGMARSSRTRVSLNDTQLVLFFSLHDAAEPAMNKPNDKLSDADKWLMAEAMANAMQWDNQLKWERKREAAFKRVVKEMNEAKKRKKK